MLQQLAETDVDNTVSSTTVAVKPAAPYHLNNTKSLAGSIAGSVAAMCEASCIAAMLTGYLDYLQVVANGDIADAPASAGNLADLLSLDAPDDSVGASASASSAVTALQDLLSGDLSSDVAAAGTWQTLLANTHKLCC